MVVLCFFLFQIGFINLENEDFTMGTVDTTQANLQLQVPFKKKRRQYNLTPECRVYKRLERKKRSATQLRKEKKKENKGGSNSYRERKLITRSQTRAGSRS